MSKFKQRPTWPLPAELAEFRKTTYKRHGSARAIAAFQWGLPRWGYLEELIPKDRDMFELYYIKGFSMGFLAREFKISIANIQQRLERAWERIELQAEGRHARTSPHHTAQSHGKQA